MCNKNEETKMYIKKERRVFSNDFTLVYLLDIDHSFPFFFACYIFIKLQTIITILKKYMYPFHQL